MSRIMREPQAVCLHQSTLTCNFSLPAFESSPLPQHDIWDLHDDEQVGADAAVLRPPEPGRRLGRPRAFHGESQGPATGGDLFQKVEPGNRDATPASGGDSGAAAADGFPLVARNAGQRPAGRQRGSGGEQPAHLHGSHGPVEERLLPNSSRIWVRNMIHLL